MKRTSWLVLAVALGAGGCYRVVIEWPKEPLRVQVAGDLCRNPTVAANAPDGGTTATPDAAAVEPPPLPQPKPVTQRLGGGPMLLTSKGTLVFVEYTNASGGSANNVYEVDGAGCGGGSRKDLWRIT